MNINTEFSGQEINNWGGQNAFGKNNNKNNSKTKQKTKKKKT